MLLDRARVTVRPAVCLLDVGVEEHVPKLVVVVLVHVGGFLRRDRVGLLLRVLVNFSPAAARHGLRGWMEGPQVKGSGTIGQQPEIAAHRELLLVHDHDVEQRDCHVDDRSASQPRPIRTPFSATRTGMRSTGAYAGSTGGRTGRKVAVW